MNCRKKSLEHHVLCGNWRSTSQNIVSIISHSSCYSDLDGAIPSIKFMWRCTVSRMHFCPARIQLGRSQTAMISGYIDLEQRSLQTIDNPFGTSVTHVLGII